MRGQRGVADDEPARGVTVQLRRHLAQRDRGEGEPPALPAGFGLGGPCGDGDRRVTRGQHLPRREHAGACRCGNPHRALGERDHDAFGAAFHREMGAECGHRARAAGHDERMRPVARHREQRATRDELDPPRPVWRVDEHGRGSVERDPRPVGEPHRPELTDAGGEAGRRCGSRGALSRARHNQQRGRAQRDRAAYRGGRGERQPAPRPPRWRAKRRGAQFGDRGIVAQRIERRVGALDLPPCHVMCRVLRAPVT